MRKCICGNDAVIICSGGGYGVTCPVCGLGTEKLPSQEEAVKAWENGKVIIPKVMMIPKPEKKVEKKEEKKEEIEEVEQKEEKKEEPVAEQKSVLFDEPIRKPRRKKKV